MFYYGYMYTVILIILKIKPSLGFPSCPTSKQYHCHIRLPDSCNENMSTSVCCLLVGYLPSLLVVTCLIAVLHFGCDRISGLDRDGVVEKE